MIGLVYTQIIRLAVLNSEWIGCVGKYIIRSECDK